MMAFRLIVLALIAEAFLFSPSAGAADAETDWKAILALDAGPQEHPATKEAAHVMVVDFLGRQDKALREFIAAHPEDERAFEARLRLARLSHIRGDMENSDKLRAEGRRMLAELERTATPMQRAELDFSKIVQRMRSIHQASRSERDELLATARKFQTDHTGDRRIAALLAEVATLFDDEPRTKETILLDAQSAATTADLKARIADDLKRVRLLGEPAPLHFTSIQGKPVSMEDFAGKPVIVIFFADFSVPSANAISAVQRAVAELPKGSVEVIGVSLDNTREELISLMKAHHIAWPVAYDGKGWQSELVRSLGVNALPTVWIIDQKGRLRSLNGLENSVAKLRQLLAE